MCYHIKIKISQKLNYIFLKTTLHFTYLNHSSIDALVLMRGLYADTD